MKIRRIDHVGIVVNDLAAAKAFFIDLGFELEGEWLDRLVGLQDVRRAINTRGIGQIALVGDDVDATASRLKQNGMGNLQLSSTLRK